MLQARSDISTDPLEAADIAVRLSGPQGLTANHNTFARRHALAEIASAFPQGASMSTLESTASRYLADPSVSALTTLHGAPARYTTVGLLACEEQIIAGAARRGADAAGLIEGELVESVLTDIAPALTAEQADAVRALTSSGRGVEAVQALAGTGKTTMLGAVADCYQQAGSTVIGTAPTGQAARELRNAAGIPAATVHALVGELERAGGFAPHTVLLIDEAGMAPTRLTARILDHAEQGGVKVIAVGDPGQLPSVQAGGWLAALSRQQPSPTLRQMLRQNDPDERRALEALHDGQPDAYLQHKHGDITIHASEGDALARVVEQWNVAQRENGIAGAVMIARDNQTRQQLNDAVRQGSSETAACPPAASWSPDESSRRAIASSPGATTARPTLTTARWPPSSRSTARAPHGRANRW